MRIYKIEVEYFLKLLRINLFTNHMVLFLKKRSFFKEAEEKEGKKIGEITI